MATDTDTEAVNIQSHVIGCILFLFFPAHFYYNFYQHVKDARVIDAVLFIVYFLGVAICFACSAT